MKTKKQWIAGILNFFFMGAGYIYNGKRVAFGIALTLAGIGLTFVEFGIKPLSTLLYGIMFASVMVANVFLAIDASKEASQINKQPVTTN